MNRLSVLVTNYLVPEVIDELKARYDVTERYNISSNELKKLIGDYDVLVCRGAMKVTKEVIDAAAKTGRLQLIASATSGLDHVDIEAARQANISVCHTPYAVTNANAEYNIGAILALSRNFIAANDQMRTGEWNQQALLGSEIKGKTLGLIGFGRIGKLTAQYADVFNMKTIAYDPYVKKKTFAEYGVKPVCLDELFRGSDFIVLQLPRTSETLNLVTKKQLSLMKPTSYIVQVSRGGIVNEKDLLAVLERGAIAGAAVDVFVKEPSINERFRKLPNVMLSPHMGCSTQQSRSNGGMLIIDEIDRFFAQEPLQYLAAGSFQYAAAS